MEPLIGSALVRFHSPSPPWPSPPRSTRPATAALDTTDGTEISPAAKQTLAQNARVRDRANWWKAHRSRVSDSELEEAPGGLRLPAGRRCEQESGIGCVAEPGKTSAARSVPSTST